MITFLIQSGISMAVLLAMYHLLLQRENMHVFNRFFLLFAICFSFIIPFVQIEVAAENVPLVPVKKMVEIVEQPPMLVDAFDRTVPRINLLPVLTWFIYLAGVLVMLARFGINLWHLRSSIVKNKVISFGNSRLVLLDHAVMPHSFLSYIFISEKDYNDKHIEEELFQHESAHVRQKHSWDILFLEVLLIVCWFNPLLYGYKKAIKLNHEFLADEAVLRSNNNVPSYQQILLQKIFMNKASGLASHVHYSLTKKRLIMMTKSTPAFRGVILKMVAGSICTGLILIFCIQSVAQAPPPPPQKPKVETTIQQPPDTSKIPPKVMFSSPWKNIKNQDSLRRVKERYYGNSPDKVIWFSNGKVFIKKPWKDMTSEEKDEVMPPPPVPDLRAPSQAQLNDWMDPKKYGVWIDGIRVSNEVLGNYTPTGFGHYMSSKLEKNAINYGKHYYQVNLTTRERFMKERAHYIKLLGVDEKQ